MTRMLAVLLPILICSPAGAVEWVHMGDDATARHYVDVDTLARNGDVVRMTKRAVFRDPQPVGGIAGMPVIRESLGVVEDDCARELHRVVSLQLLTEGDRVLWNSGDMRRVWESIDPGTPGQATLAFACARTGFDATAK
ncbi:MAG: hypothetical protein KIT73_13510 [Burkholderiales bacterium]|nr:hypothetical protein [Burkholderiales bacterium]